MKTRLGFVSNSSSSSFICDICGKEGTAYDPSELGMVECAVGHVFCKEHAVNKNVPTAYDSYNEGHWIKVKGFDDLHDDKWIPEIYCPICEASSYNYHRDGLLLGTIFTERDLLDYLLKKNDMTEKQLLNSLSEKYSSHAKFREDLAK